ncbi:MAG: hypothetical protein ACKVX7_09235 [Planctomycetota bacterium]
MASPQFGALLAALVIVCAAFGSASAQCQLTKLRASDGAAFDEFGAAVAIDGGLIVIGAPKDDPMGSDSGAAYVFRFVGTEWQEEAKLVPSDGVQNDLFGAAVAVSGDVIVVGAYAGVSLGSLRGASYVFRRVGGIWVEEAILTPIAPTLDDSYGAAVAVAGDLIAVGDPGNPVFASPPGRVFLYRRTAGVWILETTIFASNGHVDDGFGTSLACLGGDVVVGAPTLSAAALEAGGVYVFAQDGGGTWTESALAAGVAVPYGHLGHALAAAPNLIAASDRPVAPGVGSFDVGSVFVFRSRTAGVWELQSLLEAADAVPGEGFGQSVAVSIDRVLTGAYLDENGSGSAYLFGELGPGWPQLAKLRANDAALSDNFGDALAMSGETLVITAPKNDDDGPNSGCAYVYRLESVPAEFLRGDANGDLAVNIGDAIWLLSYFFTDGAPPPCAKAGDSNHDSALDLGDAIYVLNYLLLAGSPPAAPFPSCGTDPTFSSLCCDPLVSCP